MWGKVYDSTPSPTPPPPPPPSHHTHSLCILEKVWWRCNFGQLLGVVWGVVTSLRELSVERCHHFRPHPKAYLVMQSPPSHLGRTFCHPFCHLPVPICSCSEVTLVQDLQQHWAVENMSSECMCVMCVCVWCVWCVCDVCVMCVWCVCDVCVMCAGLYYPPWMGSCEQLTWGLSKLLNLQL